MTSLTTTMTSIAQKMSRETTMTSFAHKMTSFERHPETEWWIRKHAPIFAYITYKLCPIRKWETFIRNSFSWFHADLYQNTKLNCGHVRWWSYQQCTKGGEEHGARTLIPVFYALKNTGKIIMIRTNFSFFCQIKLVEMSFIYLYYVYYALKPRNYDISFYYVYISWTVTDTKEKNFARILDNFPNSSQFFHSTPFRAGYVVSHEIC